VSPLLEIRPAFLATTLQASFAMFAARILRAASSTSTITSAAAGASSLLRAKTTTELTGLAVHPAPLQALTETYGKTLSFLQTLPSESVYRQATQALTENRLEAVKKVQNFHQDAVNSGDREKVESIIGELELEIDAGQIEEVVIQANDELKLAAKMLEWKS
jgi:NADH dehydrogenase (ubiquinone) 1 alpha subcomplex subunit 5